MASFVGPWYGLANLVSRREPCLRKVAQAVFSLVRSPLRSVSSDLLPRVFDILFRGTGGWQDPTGDLGSVLR